MCRQRAGSKALEGYVQAREADGLKLGGSCRERDVQAREVLGVLGV